MHNFRTPYIPKPSKNRISLSHRILTIGSCFSDAIGSQLVANKIKCLANPFGVLYNPHSIHKITQYSTFNQPVPEDTFLQRDDVFLNYDFHSEHASSTLRDLQSRLKNVLTEANTFLKNAHWLIITYGTAWVYERKETGEVVANCHKMPQAMFTKSLMTQKKVMDSFATMYEKLKSVNPEINIILTVSPVRHLKDTLELNSVSKSVLRMTCHTLTQQYHDVHYFPAYEIMMDDLRDYRFYRADMIHPSDVAETYIWEKFGEQYFDDGVKKFLPRWHEIQSALKHRPFHAASSAHQQFLKETLKKLEELNGIVNVDEEMELVRKKLKA